MRLTKRAYAFLCRQYRLILQQNHFANAVCRGLVAGALGAGLVAGATGAMLGTSLEYAYAAVSLTPTLGANSAYTVTLGVPVGDPSYLTTFTTKDAGTGLDVTYGVKLDTPTDGGATVLGLVKDSVSGALASPYDITYAGTTDPVTGATTGTFEITKSGLTYTAPQRVYRDYYTGKYNGDFMNNTISTYANVYPVYGYFLSVGVLNNNVISGDITGDFVNNTLNYYCGVPYVRIYGGAIYNGATSESSSNEARLGDITGDFIGNKVTSPNRSGNTYGGAIANIGMEGRIATIGDITGDFIGNSAGNSGGAIYQHGSNASIGNITGNFIANNAQIGSGGALYISEGSIGTITGDFIGNWADDHGGAIFYDHHVQAGAITGDFLQNFTTYGDGGAINSGATIGTVTDASGTYSIKGDFIGNTAKGSGGAIRSRGTIQGNIIGNFYNNKAYGAYYSDYGGGAIYNTGNIAGDIKGNFDSNTANTGGAIYNRGNAYIGSIHGDYTANEATSNGGGAIYNGGVIGDIYGNFAYNKAAGSGGAIYTGNNSANAGTAQERINLIQGKFSNNTSGLSGGAIASLAYIETIRSNFENNAATQDGGALYISNTVNSIIGNFTDNRANASGGAIYNYNSSFKVGTINSLVGDFTDNFAKYKGGAIYNNAYIYGIQSDFITNTSDGLGGAVYNENVIQFLADGTGVNRTFTNNIQLANTGPNREYNAIYLDGDSSSVSRTKAIFTMNNGGTFTVNDSIQGDGVYRVELVGDNVASSILYLNDALKDVQGDESSIDRSLGILNLQNATIELGSYGAHLGGVTTTTYGTTDINYINAFDKARIALTETQNIIKTENVVLADNAVLDINTVNTLNPAAPNVKSINLNLAAGSMLNLQGDTVMEVSADTIINSATVNVGTTNNYATDESKLTLTNTNASAGRINVSGSTSELTANGATNLNNASTLFVANEATANLQAVNMNASQFIVQDTTTANLAQLLTATNGSVVSIVDTHPTGGPLADTIDTTFTPSMGATFDNATLSLTEGATYKTTTTTAKTTFTNGGLIQIQGLESESAPTGKGAETYAKLDLSGDLVLDGTTIDVAGGADLRMDFDSGAVITALGNKRGTVHVHGAGSTLLITVSGPRPAVPPQNVILALDDHATAKSDAPAFAFIGGAGLDNVLNVSAFNGSYMRFNNAYLSNADIKIADNGVIDAGGDASAFVANEVALERGTFTVRNSYAQLNQLFDNGAMLNTSSTINTLGGGSALRIAAGGIFVLGETGTSASAMQKTAGELYAGLEASNAETTGVTGTANVNWDGLGLPGPDDNAYGFSIDGAHSAFIATGGETLNVGAGSGLIIDADADHMISGGANEHLIANIPLYLGHDDVLLIDNTNEEYDSLGTNKGVIHIKKNPALDTAYILSTGSKIRVIVDNGSASAGTKFAVIYDENHAGDEHHAPGTYEGDIFFVLGNTAAFGDKTQNRFETCSHVGSNGEYFNDNRVIMKGPGTIIIENVMINSAPHTVYEFKMNIEGIKPNFGVEDELFSSLVDVYLAKDTSLNATDDATRFLTKTTVYATEKHDKDAAIKLGSVTELAVVGGVANMAHDVMTSSTNALGNYLDNGITNMGAYDERGAFSLWGMPVYSQSTVDGIKVGSIEGGYETELVSGIMGIDIRNSSGRVGVSFTAGMGETSSTRDFLQTQSDTDFYGGGLYGQYKFGDFSVRADLGYYMTENSLDQESCGYNDFGKVTADVDATIMTAGFDASYLLRFNENWAIRPHLGARYSLYNQDEFTSQVNENDFFTTKDADMSLISVPVGLSLLNTFRLGDWTFQPRLDASVIFNFGDTSVDNNVTAPSLKSFGTANIEADVLDEYIVSGNIGLDVNYNAFTFGLDYSLQQSERRTAHGVFGMVRYEF